ncbi:BYPASS-related protein [Tanacetum coccineum]
MADMTKRVPIRIVENVLVKIDKFLFPSEFIVIDMLNSRNETMILERPFLATIHAEIDVFNKEIYLGIRDDRVTFDMDKKIHNFTTSVGKVCMVNSIHNDESSTSSNTPSDKSPHFEKSDSLHHKNNDDDYMKEQSSKKAMMLKPDTNTPSVHFCKPVKQNCNGILKVWPTCDPTKKLCNEGNEIYGMDEQRVLKNWYAEWCSENSSPYTLTSIFTLVQEDCKPRPKDYPFKEWLLTKVGYIDVSEPVMKALLKSWLIDYFRKELVKDPRSRSFDDYKWVFNLEIDKLADEYELRIGKKGHMLDDIWENYKKVQGDNTHWWHDHGLEENERQESGLDIEEYDPPEIHVERDKKILV